MEMVAERSGSEHGAVLQKHWRILLHCLKEIRLDDYLAEIWSVKEVDVSFLKEKRMSTASCVNYISH